MTPIIQLENISAAYGQKTVLQDVNLTVYDHDFLGIIGPNGGGKTTLVQLIIGLKSRAEDKSSSTETEHLQTTSAWVISHNTTTSTRNSPSRCRK